MLFNFNAIFVVLCFMPHFQISAITSQIYEFTPAINGLASRSDSLELALDFGDKRIYNSKVYQDTLIYLDQLKGAPSCYRLAAKTLINACRNVEPTASLELALAEVKEEYAGRYAVCELKIASGARKSVVPGSCLKLLPSKDACSTSSGLLKSSPSSGGSSGERLCNYNLSRPVISACLQDLYKLPQSWTSYSNAGHHMHSVCYVSRMAIEKGQFHLATIPLLLISV